MQQHSMAFTRVLVLVLLTAAVLSLALSAGCEKEDAPASAEQAIEKHWTLVSMAMTGYESTASELGFSSIDIYFFADGTVFSIGRRNSGAAEQTEYLWGGTWSLDGRTLHLVIRGYPRVAELSSDGTTMVLSFVDEEGDSVWILQRAQ